MLFRLTYGRLLISLGILIVLSVFALLASGYHFLHSELPDAAVLKSQYPVVKYNGPKKPTRIILQKNRPAGWSALKDISPLAVGAIVVSEDWAFYQHHGFDPNQIHEAIKEDLEERRFVRGASTITQQVAKNVFLEKDKNLWRKLKEFWVAIELEKKVGKRKILETYLNVAEWGEGIYGISSASHHYFNKSPAELTAKEGAFLAMLLPSPKRYSISYRKHKLTNYAKETMDSILDKMVQAHYMDQEERNKELAHTLSFEQAADGSAKSADKTPAVQVEKKSAVAL